jgi:hypothetical protein
MDPQYQELLQKWADAFNKAYIGTQIFYWVLLALMDMHHLPLGWYLTEEVNWWTVFWILWIVWFLVEEGLALIHKGGTATLSAHVWDWFSVHPRTQEQS